jgi:hypothetical protein
MKSQRREHRKTERERERDRERKRKRKRKRKRNKEERGRGEGFFCILCCFMRLASYGDVGGRRYAYFSVPHNSQLQGPCQQMAARLRHVNKRSLAIQENPELFPRARGRCLGIAS